MKKKVSVVKCEDYGEERINNSINRAISKIDFDIKPHSRILIKPNLVSTNVPEQHSVTHYSLIESLCRYFIEKKCEITIGESSAFYQKGYTQKAYKTSKIYDIAKRYGIKLVSFEDEEISKVDGKLEFLDELYLPRMMNNFDLIVNVPKLKTHALMRFSGGLKNFYGIVPGGYKQLLHMKTKNINDMANVLLDIYENVKPRKLNVMDAVIGLDGGPASTGKPKKIGYVLASEDALALDIVACQMIGYSPSDLPTITEAVKRKMIKLGDVNQIGDFNQVQFEKLQKGKVKDFEKESFLINETHTWPTINNKCDNCRICIEYCPVKAISEEKGKIFVREDKCIFCYTCIPKCPVKAIYHKSTLKNKLIRLIRLITKI